MALSDLIGMVAPQTNDLGFQFARPDYGAQLVDIPTAAPASPAPASPVAAVTPPHGPSKLRSFLGQLGDALYLASGGRGTPMYQRMQQQSALQGFLTNPDQAIAQLMQVDAPSAVELYTKMHPKPDADPDIIRELRAAGIDPASEEGKAILRQHIGGSASAPNFVRELEALGIDPHSNEARELYYGRNSPAGYLLKPPTLGGGSSGPAPGTVEDGYRFKGGDPSKQENWEPVQGGATASTPSPTFR